MKRGTEIKECMSTDYEMIQLFRRRLMLSMRCHTEQKCSGADHCEITHSANITIDVNTRSLYYRGNFRLNYLNMMRMPMKSNVTAYGFRKSLPNIPPRRKPNAFSHGNGPSYRPATLCSVMSPTEN